MDNPKPMLNACSITKAYGKTEVLKNIDLFVQPGKITMLIGPSGGGKTTLVKCLAFLEHPDSGIIQFNGKSYTYPVTKKTSHVKPWPDITVVFQQHFLWPHLTIRENILLPLGNVTEEHKQRYDDLIEHFEMEAFVDNYPNEASVGQRQRAALARAFALKPKYLLLDEITSALDVEQTGAVVHHLLNLRDQGIGILVVTHLLEFARQLVSRNEGDRVYFLDGGKILGSGGSEFFDSPANPRVKRFLSSMDYWGQVSGDKQVALEGNEP